MREGAAFRLLSNQRQNRRRRPNTVIIISKYHIEFNRERNIFQIRSGEAVPCPNCGIRMTVRDIRERSVIRYDGGKEIYRLRRMRCPSCRKLQTELPDFILPFKRYDAQTIEATLDSKPDNCCAADDSTMRRWRNSFAYAQAAIAALLASYYMCSTENAVPLFNFDNILEKIRAKQKNWLAFVMRLLINSGHRVHTCFAFCP